MGENVKHFSLEEKNDNTYGWPWNEVVKTFLQSHYNDEEKQCSIKIRNKEYKILKRESVTVFYDADGNTLFDVTNDRLEKEYESGVSDAEEELENNVPVEPMEWKNGDIVQCRGSHNCGMPPEVKAFTEAFKEKMTTQMRRCG